MVNDLEYIFPFSLYEKVLVLCEKSLSEFSSYIYVLRSLSALTAYVKKISNSAHENIKSKLYSWIFSKVSSTSRSTIMNFQNWPKRVFLELIPQFSQNPDVIGKL